MNTAVIGLGSNMGDRKKNLDDAVRALSLLPRTKVAKASKIYQTKPLGYADQNDFYNAVILVETELSPQALLGGCLGIEAALGRIRLIKNGPRIIDLDLLLYENCHFDNYELTLPHPRIKERAFVMRPLLDLFPDGRAPGFYFLMHLRELGTDGVEETDETLRLP